MSDLWKLVPAPVHAVLARLDAEGFEAALVGGCVRTLVGHEPESRGSSAGEPALVPGPILDWDVTSNAPPERVLALFPHAVPIGLRHGTVMVPTPGGPVDITRYRAESLLEDLAHRDFSCNAMALPFSPKAGTAPGVLDPHAGREDLRAGRLRAVGDPRERLAEDPLRALRAARFFSCLELEPDPWLVEALSGVSLAGVAAERKRAEVERLLLGRRAGPALALLQRTGLEAQLVPNARADAPAVIAHTPFRLELRLGAWLRGSNAARVLARLRFGNAVSQRVAATLALHPIDETTAASGPSLRRTLRRVGESGLNDLLALRRAECAAGATGPQPAEVVTRRLDALERTRSELSRDGRVALVRADLAIQGADVMEALGCPAGPVVGRALAHLTECVLDEPACNTRPALLERLGAWVDPGASDPRARRG